MNPSKEQSNSPAAPSETEMLYQCLLDLSLEGLLHVDADGRITYLNARMAEMMGWTPGGCGSGERRVVRGSGSSTRPACDAKTAARAG